MLHTAGNPQLVLAHRAFNLIYEMGPNFSPFALEIFWQLGPPQAMGPSLRPATGWIHSILPLGGSMDQCPWYSLVQLLGLSL